MAVTAVIKFTTQPGKREDLITFLSGVQEAAIGAGCHSISVHRDLADENGVFEIESWDAQDNHEAFVKAAADAGAFAPLDDILAGPFAVSYGEVAKRTDA